MAPAASVHKNKQDALKIIQLNTDRNRTTIDLVTRYAKKEEVDMAILADQNKKAAVAYGTQD